MNIIFEKINIEKEEFSEEVIKEDTHKKIPIPPKEKIPSKNIHLTQQEHFQQKQNAFFMPFEKKFTTHIII